MLYSQLLRGLTVRGGRLPPEGADCSGIVSDSRSAFPGCLFVAVKGRETDGHLFLPEALARGAGCLVVSDAALVPPGASFLLVDSTRRAEALLWNTWCDRPSETMCVIAVTGTNGKTTVSRMLGHILQKAGRSCAVLGTLGVAAGGDYAFAAGGSSVTQKAAAMTTPDPSCLYPLLRDLRRRGIDTVVMEASSHALALEKLAGTRPRLAVFTNLSPEHLDFHETMDAYFSAKASLFSFSREGLVLDTSPWSARLLREAGCPCRSCRIGRPGDFTSSLVEADVTGVRFTLSDGGESWPMFCPCIGRFNGENALTAASAAMMTGVPPEVVQEALASFPGVPGRLTPVTDGRSRGIPVFIDYAHTPEALKNVLETVRPLTPGRLIVLFGCGGERDRSKRALMGRIAGQYADFTVLTSDNSRREDPILILTDILSGFPPRRPHAILPDRERAIRYAVRMARRGDTVLLCGKGHETYEIDATGKHPFDETKIVLDALGGKE